LHALIRRIAANIFFARGACRRSISSGLIFTVGAAIVGGFFTNATSLAGEQFA
jgi:hypothetical protein